jgi:hypothetical protein
MDLDDLGCAIFDFLTSFVRVPKAKEALINGRSGGGSDLMRDLLLGVLGWTQVTRANVIRDI